MSYASTNIGLSLAKMIMIRSFTVLRIKDGENITPSIDMKLESIESSGIYSLRLTLINIDKTRLNGWINREIYLDLLLAGSGSMVARLMGLWQPQLDCM